MALKPLVELKFYIGRASRPALCRIFSWNPSVKMSGPEFERHVLSAAEPQPINLRATISTTHLAKKSIRSLNWIHRQGIEGKRQDFSGKRWFHGFIFKVSLKIHALWAWLEKRARPKESAHENLRTVVPTTGRKVKHEQIQKNVTNDLALRISHRVVSKIQISSVGWKDKRRSGDMCSQSELTNGMWSSRVECAKWPRSLGSDGPAQNKHIQIYGSSERKVGTTRIQRVPGFAQKALLGQSFMVAGILRRHGGVGWRTDTQVCKISRTSRSETRRVPIWAVKHQMWGKREQPCPF